MIDPAELDFEAGQWISVPFGPKVVRAWTILSSPTRRRTITLSVDVAPGGLGSQWLRALKTGDPVEFKGPTGAFVFNRADPRRAVFVAEEIGIVPIRAILADLDEQGATPPATLVYWARDAGWLAYDAELRGLARQPARFAYHPVTPGDGEPAAMADRLVGDVTGLVAYVAGGEATIKAVRAALMAKGMERKAVKWEKFW
jgi:ferredoxin-NADP reductase